MCSRARQTHALIHKRSIILALAPGPIDETKCDSTARSLPDSRAHQCVWVRVRAAAGPGRRCGSQLRRLCSEHQNGSGTKRSDRGARELEAFFRSRPVTVGRPARSSRTGFYWTGAASDEAETEERPPPAGGGAARLPRRTTHIPFRHRGDVFVRPEPRLGVGVDGGVSRNDPVSYLF